MDIAVGVTADGVFYIRRSDMERIAKRMGLSADELAARIGARPEQAGRGVRYIIEWSWIFDKLLDLERRIARLEGASQERGANIEQFVAALDAAIRSTAGPTGYSSLRAVRDLVVSRLGLSDAQFVELFTKTVLQSRGKYILLEGGDYKVHINGKSYGYIKIVQGYKGSNTSTS